jgi:hypothetical protein
MDDSDQKPPPFPRLAISDLFLLTLTVGIALGIVATDLHEFIALPIEELRIPRWLGVVPSITDYITFGISLFGLITLARLRSRRVAIPCSPGPGFLLRPAPTWSCSC